jgi:excinuclease UvrABC helicase subunit UvrB
MPVLVFVVTVFKTSGEYRATGDQPQAIETLVESVSAGERYQMLLGATGTGKRRRWPGTSRRSVAPPS